MNRRSLLAALPLVRRKEEPELIPLSMRYGKTACATRGRPGGVYYAGEGWHILDKDGHWRRL